MHYCLIKHKILLLEGFFVINERSRKLLVPIGYIFDLVSPYFSDFPRHSLKDKGEATGTRIKLLLFRMSEK